MSKLLVPLLTASYNTIMARNKKTEEPSSTKATAGEEEKQESDASEDKKKEKTPEAPTPENVVKKHIPPKGLHLYSKDMADVLKKQQESGAFMKAAIAKHKEKEEKMKLLALRPKRNVLLMAGSLILLIAGLSLVGFVVLSKKSAVVPGPPSQIPSLIFADTENEIDISDLSKKQIAKAIQDELKKRGREFDTIENVYLTEVIPVGKVLVNASRFFSALESKAPQSLVQSLSPQFMIGIHSREKDELFLLFKATHSFNAFEGMVLWEERMFDDLYLLFDIDVSGENEVLFNKRFENTFIQNRDSRVIKNNRDQIVLFYLFIDTQTIIITRSETALEEVLDRLSTQQIRR